MLVVSIVIAILVSIVSRRVVVVVASVVSSCRTHVRYGTTRVGFSRGDGAKKRQWNTDGGRPSLIPPPPRPKPKMWFQKPPWAFKITSLFVAGRRRRGGRRRRRR